MATGHDTWTELTILSYRWGTFGSVRTVVWLCTAFHSWTIQSSSTFPLTRNTKLICELRQPVCEVEFWRLWERAKEIEEGAEHD
jgi:hypothetical protein